MKKRKRDKNKSCLPPAHDFESSSMHGLRYLAPSNPVHIRILWLIIVTASGCCCSFMIFTNLKESNKHPVATSIHSVPISKFPFPAVSFFPESRVTSASTLLEQVLNHFSYHCYHEHRSENCTPRAKEVREHFQKDIESAIYMLMEEKEYHVINEMVSSPIVKSDVLCDSLDDNFRNVVHTLLSLNFTDVHPDIALSMSRALGLPRGEMEEKLTEGIREKLEGLFNGTSFNFSSSSCPVRESEHWLKAKLMTLAFFFHSQASPIPLGSLLYGRNFNQDPYLKILDNIKLKENDASAYDIFTFVNLVKVSKYSYCHFLGKDKFDSEAHDEQLYQCDPKLMSSANKDIGHHGEFQDLRQILSLGVIPFTVDLERQRMVRQLAVDAARILGMTENNLLQEEEVGQYPTRIWMCMTHKLKPVPCPTAGLSHSDDGYAVTLNGGKWEDVFTSSGEGYNNGWSGEVASLNEDLILFVDNVDGPYVYLIVYLTVSESYFWFRLHMTFHAQHALPSNIQAMQIKPGYSYTFALTATKMESDANVAHLPLDKRQCVMDSEWSSDIFTTYGKENCVFECKVKTSAANCSCIPWDYPHFGNHQLCEYAGWKCFKETMNAHEELCRAEEVCPEACDLTSYSMSRTVKGVEYFDLCLKWIGKEDWDSLLTLPTHHPMQSLRDLDPNHWWMLYQPGLLKCVMALKSSSIIRIHSATKRVSVIRQRQRLSFGDHLASLGKCILFT